MTDLFSHAGTRQRSGALLLSAGIATVVIAMMVLRIRSLENSPIAIAHVTTIPRPSTPASLPAEVDWPKSEEDLWLPFVGKIARERHLEVTRVEIGPVLSSSSPRIRTTPLNLTIKGEYADIKTLVIAMQDRFRGMTLSKLSVRRTSELPTNVSAGAVGVTPAPTTLEANVEMTQFTHQESDEHR